MNKFNFLEIIEITFKMAGVIAFLPACYFILIMMIEIQNSLVNVIV